jgi:quinoprotein glucose dehydrogenase
MVGGPPMADEIPASYYIGPTIFNSQDRYLPMRCNLSTRLLGLIWLMIGASVLGADAVDTSPLPLKTVRTFPNLKPRRPVAITNAADGTNRLFIVSEYGQLLFIKNDQNVTDTQTFLDIESKVDYEDKENEEGLLGLAIHPKFKQNGELFIYYTIKDPPHTSIISRFKIDKNDPNKCDPKSEEVILTIKQPFWNHNGGNLLFGPDGYLYIGLGDGGSANDPQENGQKLSTLLGKILRIDVDHKEGDKNYAIPKDNPFVGKGDARPEIYALGVRNIWGMSFDPATKLFYAADVGQNLWEEINIIEKGGNYGWSIRESFHKFDKTNPKVTTKTGPGRTPDLQNIPDIAGKNANLIDPIWEYHHDTDGKSITGGVVYRGKRLPDLVGYYVYADYVSGKIWGLKYDEKAKKVTANRPIAGPPGFNIPCMCIGTDEAGEIYLGDSFGQIWWFEK